MHVRLPQRKRVNILWLQIRKRVVDESVRALVAANRIYNIQQSTDIMRVVAWVLLHGK